MCGSPSRTLAGTDDREVGFDAELFHDFPPNCVGRVFARLDVPARWQAQPRSAVIYQEHGHVMLNDEDGIRDQVLRRRRRFLAPIDIWRDLQPLQDVALMSPLQLIGRDDVGDELPYSIRWRGERMLRSDREIAWSEG